MAPPTRKVKGQKRPFGSASAKSTHKKLAVADEEDFENSQDVEELQKLVLEAQRSKPKEKKIKISKSSLSNDAGEDDDDDEDDAEEDREDDEDNLDEEARVLLEIKREREALENEEEVEGDEDDYDAEDFAQERAPVINDAPQMRQLAEELTLPNFVEALAVVQEFDEEEEGGDKINPEDDKEREGLFKQIAERAVVQGREALLKLDVPFYRPHDYMAEMIKSDDHMARVKRRILFEQEKIRAVEARKAAVRNRNRRKEVKKTRTGEKATQKRKASDLSQGFRDKKKDFSGKDAKRGDRNERNAAKTKKVGGASGGGGGGGGAGKRLGKDKRKSSKGQGGRKH